VHAEPVLYLTLSPGQQRTQNLGEDWGGGRAAPPPGARGAAPPAAGRGAAPAGALVPSVRPTSTTSYYDLPITHRITNVGDRLFRFMVVTNASPGDEGPADHGFTGKAELSNRWFRAYRITLAPGQKTEPHKHSTESVIVQISDGHGHAVGPMNFELGEPGRWAWFDKDTTHEIRNAGTVPLEVIEVDVRR
jgi:quercetin dioxygenase-like cupin family protein